MLPVCLTTEETGQRGSYHHLHHSPAQRQTLWDVWPCKCSLCRIVPRCQYLLLSHLFLHLSCFHVYVSVFDCMFHLWSKVWFMNIAYLVLLVRFNRGCRFRLWGKVWSMNVVRLVFLLRFNRWCMFHLCCKVLWTMCVVVLLRCNITGSISVSRLHYTTAYYIIDSLLWILMNKIVWYIHV